LLVISEQNETQTPYVCKTDEEFWYVKSVVHILTSGLWLERVDYTWWQYVVESLLRVILEPMCFIERAIDIQHVKFEVFMAVTMKNGVFWNVTPCGSCKNLTRATRRNIPEDTILDIQHAHWSDVWTAYMN
jgi:hypothetical protein